MSTPSSYPPPDPNTEKAKQDFFNLASWGARMWIAVILVPTVILVLCCGMCLIGGVLGGD